MSQCIRQPAFFFSLKRIHILASVLVFGGKMYSLKKNAIGIYEKAIPNSYDWATKIKIAKMAGFDFIEMSVDESDERLNRLYWSKEQRSYLRNLLFENDMYINSICLSGHRRFPFGSKDKEKQARAYDIMDRCISLARDLGVRNIQLAGYDVYYEESDEKTLADFVKGLKYSADQAMKAGVMLSIEIMDTHLCGTISRTLKYIEDVDSKWLNIYPDIGNLSQWTNEPEKELELGFKYIVGLHLKDTKPGIFKNVPFGEGTVNFEKLFNKINELGFVGPYLIEMWADNAVFETEEEVVERISAAKSWLSNKSKGAF